ncbi:MAG: ornithine carbamoyltransferase [Candidatus Omnitrophica bacterium]|nr:ornithine carbamoyltransferase [Candidatus Omnitrophota bacterium]
MKHFISISDLTKKEIEDIFSLTDEVKAKKDRFKEALNGKSLALIFQKPSNRTRVSFEAGMTQLGGHAIYLGPDDIKLGVREAIKDVAKVLSGYVDGIVARTFSHNDVLELAQNAAVPVINGLSDLMHPCQAMADVYTIREKLGGLSGIKLAFVGDGNNVLNSLLQCAVKIGINMSIAAPKGYEPKKEIIKGAMADAAKSGSRVFFTNDPADAAKDAQVLYTDVWTSMGQEKEYKKRLNDFKGFQVNKKLLAFAKKGCLVMHCLPAHRGEEITDEVLDGPNSIVIQEAENRLHVQKAILLKLLDGVK